MIVILDIKPCDTVNYLGSIRTSRVNETVTLYCATGKRSRENLHPVDEFVLLDCLHMLNQDIKFHEIEEICVPINAFLRYGLHREKTLKMLRYVLKTHLRVFNDE